jgi:hypothetical protein
MGTRFVRFFGRLTRRRRKTLKFCAFVVSERDLSNIGDLFR